MNPDSQHQSKALDMDDLHVAIRAAAAAYGSKSFVIVGRASLAASLPEADADLRATMDVDLFPPWDDAKAGAWAAADIHVGRLSAFRNEHGFYVERVAEWTTKQLPASWEQRATRFAVGNIEVAAIHPLDLIYAKLQAARLKDLLFIRRVTESRLVSEEVIQAFICEQTSDDAVRSQLLKCLASSKDAIEEEDVE